MFGTQSNIRFIDDFCFGGRVIRADILASSGEDSRVSCSLGSSNFPPLATLSSTSLSSLSSSKVRQCFFFFFELFQKIFQIILQNELLFF